MRTLVLVAMISLVTSATALWGQDEHRWAVELRGGLTHPVPCLHVMCYEGEGEFRPLLEGVGEVRMVSGLSLYGTYSRYTVQTMAGTGSGFGLGLRLGTGERGWINPWLRAGALMHQRDSSDYGRGAEFGGGILLLVSPSLAVSPGLRYQTHSNEGPAGVRSTYHRFALDVGLRFHP